MSNLKLKKTNKEIRFYEYFESRYKIKIKNLNQPILLSKPKEKDRRGGNSDNFIYLIPELVRMTGLTSYQNSNYKLTQSISEWARMTPAKRIEELNNFALKIKNNDKVLNILKEFNISIQYDLVKLNGRILPPEKIIFKKNVYCEREANWSRQTIEMVNDISIKNWYIICPKSCENEIKDLLRFMMRDSSRYNIVLEMPNFFYVYDERNAQSYIKNINDCIFQNPNFIFVVIPNDFENIYSLIKKRLCVEEPIPSQIVTFSNVLKNRKKYSSIAIKIIIQMATKLRGVPWKVDIPFKNVMIAGFDVFHDKNGYHKGQSVGAFVASYNNSFTQVFSKAIIHSAGTELCTEIESVFEKCLNNYKKKNKSFPNRVFFYRDDVGSSQLKEIINHEVDALQRILKSKQVLQEIPEGIKLTFILVSKRINTRFMAFSKNMYFNPPSGTIIDYVVTCPERYDFFLISQSVNQGTVTPTLYNIIKDENGLKPDKIQILTYKLTHLYYNMCSTIRVPAPCFYAHRLAELVGKNLKQQAHSNLDEYFYYI